MPSKAEGSSAEWGWFSRGFSFLGDSWHVFPVSLSNAYTSAKPVICSARHWPDSDENRGNVEAIDSASAALPRRVKMVLDLQTKEQIFNRMGMLHLRSFNRERYMIEYFDRNWWLWSLRGVMALIFGLAALRLDSPTMTAMVLLFSGFMFADGIFALLTLFARRTDERWSWTVVFEGITGIVAAIAACIIPDMSVLILLAIVGAWGITTGILKLGLAYRCSKASCVPGSFLLGLAGLGAIALGATFTFFQAFSYVSISWMIGAYAVLLGVLMLMEGLRLKRFYRVFDVKKVHLQIQHPYYPA
jgi:uncharacterized membrane protein HdeD (DUF308 family)